MSAYVDPEVPPKIAAQRLRAARSFAGLDQAHVAAHLGTSVVTLKRMEKGTRDKTSLDELYAVADLTGVPRAFMEHGFTPDRTPVDADDVRAIVTQALAGLASTAKKPRRKPVKPDPEPEPT